METNLGDWNELIRRRAISDLSRVINECNDEITKIVEEYRLKLARMTKELDSYQYTSEEFMQLETSLFVCKGYFTQDTDKTFEEYIGTKNSDTNEIEYDKGAVMALRLVDCYAKALKMKVLESASNDVLGLSRENSDE